MTDIQKNQHHRTAGHRHMTQMAQKNIRHHEHEIEETDREIIAVQRDYHDHTHAHDVSFRNVEGLEHAVVPIPSQIDKSHHYLAGLIVSLIVAIGFGTWFATMTIVTENVVLLVVASAIIAAVIGTAASLVFHLVFRASPQNPHAMRIVDLILSIAATIFFILLGLFLWCRFNSDSWLAQYLSSIMVGMEMSALIVAGGCECGYRVFRWSAKLHRKYRRLIDRKAHHETALEEELANLEELHARNGHDPVSQHPDTVQAGHANAGNHTAETTGPEPARAAERHDTARHDTARATAGNGHAEAVLSGNHPGDAPHHAEHPSHPKPQEVHHKATHELVS